jgi:hypothetical protein
MPHSIATCLEISKKTTTLARYYMASVSISSIVFPHGSRGAPAPRGLQSPIGRIGWTSRNLMPSSICDHGAIMRKRYEPAAS